MSIGGPFRGQGSPPEGDFYTEADLKSIADDTNAVLDEIDPYTKIGHNSAQLLARRSGLYAEGDAGETPNTGSWRNFRVADGKLLADVVGMPGKLARLFEAKAFGKRSIEMKPYESQKGRGKFNRVIRAVALLGAKAPAIKTLDDVTALYGDDEIDDADLIVVEYAEEGEATATLDLRLDLQTDDGVSPAPADTRVEMAETTETVEETKGLALSEDDAKRLAESLGVEGDVTPASLLARATEIRTLADAATEGDEDEGDGDDEGDAGDGEPAKVEPVGVSLSEVEYHDLRARADAGAEAAEQLRVSRRDSDLVRAMEEGKITPAAHDEFVRLYDEDEDSAKRILGALAPNEDHARIYGDDGDAEVTDSEQRLYEELSEMTGVPRHSDRSAE